YRRFFASGHSGNPFTHYAHPHTEFLTVPSREASKGRILPAHVAGGPNNPLGARALYIGNTLYRVHGTNQPWTVGQANSSGCIRMTNQDVIDLYDRVKVGAQIIVRH
ncbi:L,D-transpeptidase, partial [Mesorhizobium sp. M1233]|uniref:L,D-transpeptidase n=1 Tax=Mesorhizobium sp. M1233 TaxID=2957072 RepID=UPI00333AF9BF